MQGVNRLRDDLVQNVSAPAPVRAVVPVGMVAAVRKGDVRCPAAKRPQRRKHLIGELRVLILAAAVKKDQQGPARAAAGWRHQRQRHPSVDESALYRHVKNARPVRAPASGHRDDDRHRRRQRDKQRERDRMLWLCFDPRPGWQRSPADHMLAVVTSTRESSLQALLDGRYAELRAQIKQVLGRPEFAPPIGISTAEYRKKVLQWAKHLADEGLTAPGFPKEFGGRGDPGANVAAFEALALGDLSLLVKFGVQFGLWGGAVHQLGTREHHERYLKDIASLELPGAFAMTETGHGSNVQHLETTATSTHGP